MLHVNMSRFNKKRHFITCYERMVARIESKNLVGKKIVDIHMKITPFGVLG